MKRTCSRLLSSFLLLAASGASAQTASLVKDINPGLGYERSLFAGDVASIGGKILFRGYEDSSGGELWSVDGSGTGARLLADLCPGRCSSDPTPLGTLHSLLFGLTHPDFGSTATYLWRSDGTRQGTFLLPDPLLRVYLRADVYGEDPPPVAFGQEVVYFAGCDFDHGCQLWRTDGSPEGTRIVRSIQSASSSFSPSDLTIAGSRVFFALNSQLWVSDGTADGTVLVKTLSSAPRRLAALGTKLFFLAQGAAGEELWVSDGTAEGTRALTDLGPAQPFLQTLFLKPMGDKIYFVADDAEHGAELWRSDGTAAGTVRITDFGFHNPFNWDDSFGDGGLPPGSLALFGGRVVFWATDGLNGFNLWSTQGTPASTAPVCAGCSFYSGDASPELFPVSGRLLFRADSASQPANVWATDGTSQGTRPACTGACHASSDLVAGPGGVYFSSGSALWKSNGAPQGSRSLAEVDVVQRHYTIPDLAFLGTTVYAVARTDFGDGQEIWRIDGTPAGNKQVSLRTGGPSADIAGAAAVGDRVYFTACIGEVRQVWYSRVGGETASAGGPLLSCDDRTSFLINAGDKAFLVRISPFEGTQIWTFGPGGSTLLTTFDERPVDSFVAFKGQLFFSAYPSSTDSPLELWSSDGTPQGTHKVVELPVGLNLLKFPRVVGSNLWFLAEDYGSTGEIWRTDGTQGGTVRVFSGSRTTHDPEATQVGSRVYFVALKPGGDDYDYQVYRTDESLQGATAVTDFPALNAARAIPGSLASFQGSLFFAAYRSAGEGPALWRSDGTAASTVPLRTFANPFNSEFGDPPPVAIRVVGSQLVLSADDGVHGTELWRSDGTAAGTTLLRDIFPGTGGSQPDGFRDAVGNLYFSAADDLHGRELWRTDGTPDGTRLVQDIAPEELSSYPSWLTVVGNQLFFGADDGIVGEELWSLPLNGGACQPSATALCLSGGRYRVEASWEDFSQNSGGGHAVALSADTGYFWFFDPANVETIVKVLDGGGINGHVWVFYGALSNVGYTLTVTDTRTGVSRRYSNIPGQFASVGDTQAFGPNGAKEARLASPLRLSPQTSERIDLAAAAGTCVPDSSHLCLNGGRFAVATSWKDFSGHTGTGTAVGLTGDTGYFWFFDAANVEMVLKVLDGRPVNGRFWVYYGALSNVEYTVTVTDTMTGAVKTYKNPAGQFASVGDGAAF
jgi:ELWxxDGT repeat protein